VTSTTPTAIRGSGRRRTSSRQLAAAVVLAVVAVVLLAPASPAWAHAVMTGSTPADGESLDAPPSEVTLSFNEPVAVNEGSLRVFDAEGQRIDTGLVDGGDGATVTVGLPGGLDDAAYVATYRVVSTDSHPITGTITFTLGEATPLDAEAVAAIAGPGDGPLGIAGSILRGIGYVGTLLAAGAVIFAAVVARGPADRERSARVGRPAALLGAGAVALHLPVQAAAVSGFGLLSAVSDPAVLGDTLTSGFGQSWVARLVALLALAVPWFVAGTDRPVTAGAAADEPTSARPGTRYPLAWLGAAAAIALGSYLLDGHQRSIEPTWLLVGGDAIHLAGAAAWFGGLVLVFVTLRQTRLEDDPIGAATVIARFSRLAFWSVIALALAGTAMSLALVRSLDALTSTAYGWTLLAKVGLVAVTVAIAAYNRRRLVPAVTARVVPAGGSVDATTPGVETPASDRADAWSALSRTVRTEAVLLVAVLGLTGFLVTTQPAAEAAGLAGPTMLSAPFGDDLTLDLTVTPSAAGLNTLHIYTLEPSGQPSGAVEELRLEFTYVDEDIGPFLVEPFVAGPGHWTASISDLRFSGDWEVRVVGGLGRFEEADVTLPFVVR
jgi:copper transport protein